MATTFTISIGCGTDQIQQSIIGERVLRLPAEPRVGQDAAVRGLPPPTQACDPPDVDGLIPPLGEIVSVETDWFTIRECSVLCVEHAAHWRQPTHLR